MKRYNKLGYRLLFKNFRYYFFGNKAMTRKRCGEFFDCETNFVKLAELVPGQFSIIETLHDN
jgi:hypothetical protein